MGKAIGIRLPKEVLKQIENLGKEEMEDRSSVIRKLVIRGYKNLVQEKAAQEYLKGQITISQAAHMAGLTIWEMERHLVEQGFKSSYSTEDLTKEINLLKGHDK